jgi:hypothetical protein
MTQAPEAQLLAGLQQLQVLVLVLLMSPPLLWHQLAHLLRPWKPQRWQRWPPKRTSGAASQSCPAVRQLLALQVQRGQTPPG